jgi:predicted PurR-regulated permease PerM
MSRATEALHGEDPLNKISPERVDRFEARVIDLAIRLTLLGLFVYLSVVLIRPFLPIGIWAIVLAVALAPVHAWLTARLWGSRGLAAALLSLIALLVVIGPVAALARSFVETMQVIVASAQAGTLRFPEPPARLLSLPLVGERIEAFWILGTDNLEEAGSRYREILAPFRAGLLALLSAVGFDLLKFIASVIVAGVLLVRGPVLVHGARLLASRILAPRGAQFIDLAGKTIRSVSRGVVGVALLQTLLISGVLQVAGVPGVGLLAFMILVLCVVQIGPGLVVLPVLVWAWLTMATGPALLLTVALVPLTLMDNVLKPMLMGRGLSTPTLVIFLGVVGGTLTYGLIGLFLGPVVLAVFYDLIVSWTLYGTSPATVEKSPISE